MRRWSTTLLCALSALPSGCGKDDVRVETWYSIADGGSVEWNIDDFAFKVRAAGGKLFVDHEGRTVELEGAPRPARVQLEVANRTLTLSFPEGGGLEWSGDAVRRGGREHRLLKPGQYVLGLDGSLAGPSS